MTRRNVTSICYKTFANIKSLRVVKILKDLHYFIPNGIYAFFYMYIYTPLLLPRDKQIKERRKKENVLQ